MTIHLALTPLTYSIGAFLIGGVLMATSESVGSFIQMPGMRFWVGLLLWLSIPFVWLGALIR